jgi:hypothetical protein
LATPTALPRGRFRIQPFPPAGTGLQYGAIQDHVRRFGRQTAVRKMKAFLKPVQLRIGKQFQRSFHLA